MRCAGGRQSGGQMKAPMVVMLMAMIFVRSEVLRAAEPDPQVVSRITGLEPEVKNGIVTVRVPRKDLGIVVDGRTLDPFQGLTSWAAFRQAGDQTMVMGDLTLVQEEVSPAMRAALDNGLEVTALHNHFLFDQPRVLFMHIGGMGTTEQLARGVRETLDAIAKVQKPNAGGGSHSGRAAEGGGPASPAKSTLQPGPLEAILGPSNAVKDGMVKFVFGKKTTMHGIEAGAPMGVNTWAVFAGSASASVVDGDFAMLQAEVRGVLKALTKANIDIVAIHSHMIDEEPRIVFLHFWGRGPAEELARGVRAALDTQQK
jgi:hypothetical protein